MAFDLSILNEEERDSYLASLNPNTKYDIARMKGLGEMLLCLWILIE